MDKLTLEEKIELSKELVDKYLGEGGADLAGLAIAGGNLASRLWNDGQNYIAKMERKKQEKKREMIAKKKEMQQQMLAKQKQKQKQQIA